MSESFDTAKPAAGMRQLPHSLENEEKFLSECLIDGVGMLARAQKAGITHATFYSAKHGLIYNTMLDLHARQMTIDVFKVAEELKEKRSLDAVGGYAFLTQISKVVPTTIEADYVIDLLKRHERRRQLITRAERLTEDCYGKDDDVIAQDIGRINATIEQRDESRTWIQAVNEAEEVTRDRMQPPEKRDKSKMLELSWGIRDFDRCFQPIELGELVVIGGYTSSGKSSLLRQVIWSIVMAGHGAMIETIETLDREEAINLAAHIAGIRGRARLHDLHDKDRSQLLAAFDRMRVPHFMVSHQEHSLGAMFSRARAFKRTQRLRALGTDYLQIMEDVSRMKTSSDRAIAIAGVTGACKQFATKEELAVFLLSGFNREYIRGNREPVLSDLEGGSSIEKDASRVLLIHVPSEYVLDGQKFAQNLTANAFDVPRFYVKVIQAKGRDQGTSSVGMMFHRETKTFHQLQREKPKDEESPELY